MGVNARFQADFRSFEDAVARADVSLADFAKGASRVEGSLNRLVDSFSGRKIIQDATLAADAVERIGGTSKLTERELQTLANQAATATEKMRLMGLNVPERLETLAAQAKKSGGFLSDLGSEVGKIALGFISAQAVIAGVERAVSGLIDAAVGAVQFASHLDDLSKATGIGVESLQQLGFAGKRVGIDLDEIGSMVGQLSKRLATGDSSAVAAVQSLGLNLADLKSKKPEDLFVTVAEAVASIQSPLAQAGIGSELFGKKFQGVLQLAKDNLRQTMQQAQDFGAVLSKDDTKALDDFGDKVGDLTSRLKVLTAEALAPVVKALNSLLGIAKDTAAMQFIDPKQEAEFKKFGVAVGAAADAGKGLGAGITVVGAAAQALAAGNSTVITSAQLLANKLNALRAEALTPLTEAQKKSILELESWGVSLKETAELVESNEHAVKSFIDAHKKAIEDLAKAQAEADAISMIAYENQIRALQELTAGRIRAYGFQGQVEALRELGAAENELTRQVYAQLNSDRDRAKVIEENARRHIELMNAEMAVQERQKNVVNEAILKELEAQIRLNEEWGLRASGALGLQLTALEQLQLAMDKLHATKIDGISQAAQEQLLIDKYTQSLYLEALGEDAARDAISKRNKELEESAALMEKANKALTEFFDPRGEKIDAAFLLAHQFDQAFQAALAEARRHAPPGSNILPYAKPYASGGPVTETGLIFAHAGEYVLPKNAAGGMVVTINVNGSVLSNKDDLARAVRDALVSYARGLGQRLSSA